MAAFRKFRKLMDKVYVAAGVLLLAAIVTASTIQVFTRYVLGAAVTGTEEFSRYCFIWMSMLAPSIATGQWLHPTISIVTDKLHGTAKKIVMTALHLIIIACSALFVVYGCKLIGSTTHQLSSIMGLPMCYIYLSLPVGGVGMAIHSVGNILDEFSPEKEQEAMQ